MSRNLIGLTGAAGVGKDTVALLLTSSQYSRYAFAQPLKEALSVLGIAEPTSREAKEADMEGRPYSYRKAAQTLGTEWARNLDPNFWLNLATQKTEHIAKLVVTDVRFENEANWIRSKGGVIWHITGRAPTVTGDAAKHASEKSVAFQDGDFRLDNSGTVDQLKRNVKILLEQS